MSENIEILVRGVQLLSGLILLVQKRGASHTFLPGGHILFGESAENALVREITEELGRSARIVHFLGAVEHAWTFQGDKHHELNLIFKIEIEGLHPGISPLSMETNLKFLWKPMDGLKDGNLQPHPLQKLLPLWLKNKVTSHWGSSFYGYG